MQSVTVRRQGLAAPNNQRKVAFSIENSFDFACPHMSLLRFFTRSFPFLLSAGNVAHINAYKWLLLHYSVKIMSSNSYYT